MLILVRHGRTVANAQGLLSGRIDVALDPLGHQQAVAAAAAVGPVDRVIASPLGRTRSTAAAWGVDVEIDDRFIELDYGEFDGVPLRDVPPDTWAKWRTDLDFRPPGSSESINDLGRRVRAGLDDLASAAKRDTIVVVSHVSPIKAAVAWALGVDDAIAWRLSLATASITRIAVGPNGTSLHTFNDVSHLAAMQ